MHIETKALRQGHGKNPHIGWMGEGILVVRFNFREKLEGIWFADNYHEVSDDLIYHIEIDVVFIPATLVDVLDYLFLWLESEIQNIRYIITGCLQIGLIYRTDFIALLELNFA